MRTSLLALTALALLGCQKKSPQPASRAGEIEVKVWDDADHPVYVVQDSEICFQTLPPPKWEFLGAEVSRKGDFRKVEWGYRHDLGLHVRVRAYPRDAGSGAISLEDAVVTAKAEHDLEPERKPASIEWTYEQVSDSPMSGGGRQMVVVGTRELTLKELVGGGMKLPDGKKLKDRVRQGDFVLVREVGDWVYQVNTTWPLELGTYSEIVPKTGFAAMNCTDGRREMVPDEGVGGNKDQPAM